MREDTRGRAGGRSVLHVYLSPEHAGKSRATLASWYVDDVEGLVDELISRGVAFERYDVGPTITDEKGVATVEGGAEIAYFRDPDGNTLSIAKKPRTRSRSEPVYSPNVGEEEFCELRLSPIRRSSVAFIRYSSPVSKTTVLVHVFFTH
jgi:hypothetical protein